MSARNIAIIDPDGRVAAVTRTGLTWSVHCAVVIAEDAAPCQDPIGPYGNRAFGIAAAEKHLLWHAAGKPVCTRCGARMSQKGAKRCQAGTCEVTR